MYNGRESEQIISVVVASYPMFLCRAVITESLAAFQPATKSVITTTLVIPKQKFLNSDNRHS